MSNKTEPKDKKPEPKPEPKLVPGFIPLEEARRQQESDFRKTLIEKKSGFDTLS